MTFKTVDSIFASQYYKDQVRDHLVAFAASSELE
jgi:hypothetical protein